MQRLVLPVLASLLAGLAMPLLYIVAETLALWEPLVAGDLEFAYTVVAPFTLLSAFALAWPSYRLQPGDRRGWRRLLSAMALCFAGGTVLVWPLSGEFPWKAGIAASATVVLWAGIYHLGRAVLARRASGGGRGRYPTLTES